MLNGADWSAYQGYTPDTRGLEFVIIKCTEGTSWFNSGAYRSQLTEARKAGLVVGHYHFGHGNPSAEADFFLSKVDLQPGEFIVYDWESSDAANLQTMETWLRKVKANRPKAKVGLYCNLNFWGHIDSPSYCGDFLFIADPNHAPGHPGISHTWAFDQYGITGSMDRDVANFPTKAAMQAYFTWPTATVVPSPTSVSTRPSPAPVRKKRRKRKPAPVVHHWTDRTTWGGHVVNWATAEALTKLQDLCGFPLRVIQGSYNTGGVSASAGTHNGGNAVDVAVPTDPHMEHALLVHARMIGFCAWHRKPSQGPWIEHNHMILSGGGDPSPAAAAQIYAYWHNKNGLANNGPDDFWRPTPLRTFHFDPKGSA